MLSLRWQRAHEGSRQTHQLGWLHLTCPLLREKYPLDGSGFGGRNVNRLMTKSGLQNIGQACRFYHRYRPGRCSVTQISSSAYLRNLDAVMIFFFEVRRQRQAGTSCSRLFASLSVSLSLPLCLSLSRNDERKGKKKRLGRADRITETIKIKNYFYKYLNYQIYSFLLYINKQ